MGEEEEEDEEDVPAAAAAAAAAATAALVGVEDGEKVTAVLVKPRVRLAAPWAIVLPIIFALLIDWR